MHAPQQIQARHRPQQGLPASALMLGLTVRAPHGSSCRTHARHGLPRSCDVGFSFALDPGCKRHAPAAPAAGPAWRARA